MRSFFIVILLSMLLCFTLQANYDGFLWEYNADKNNCYAYALGIHSDRYIQPGKDSGRIYEIYDCNTVDGHYGNFLGLIPAAINDGLIRANSTQECGPDNQLVALVVTPRIRTVEDIKNGPPDYHWLRYEDERGYWSHKQGDLIPTNLDFSGNTINDVKSADLGRYTIFCSYFCVDYNKLKINRQ